MITDTEATKRHAKRQGKNVVTDFVLVDDDEKPQEVVRILDSDPIRKLLNRGAITKEQFEAAEKLYSDWYIGGMSPRLVKPIKIVQVDEGSPELNESEMREFCMSRCFAAMKFVRAKQLQDVIEAVVFHCLSVSVVAKNSINMSDQSRARVIIADRLKMGLDLLIEFYENN